MGQLPRWLTKALLGSVALLVAQPVYGSLNPTVRLTDAPTPGPWFAAQLIAQEMNTTPGRPLRIYDRHIAHMFAVTEALCRRFPQVQGWRWDYRAGSGAIPMGEFRIPCEMAAAMKSQFELGPGQTIAIQVGRQSQNLVIRPLNITSEQVPAWLDVTETFRPWVSSDGQIRQIMSTLRRVKIPVLLPDDPLRLGDMQLFFVSTVSRPDQYDIVLYSFPGCRAGACTVGSYSGQRGGKLAVPRKESPRDTHQTVRLANGIQGQFINSCGAYCTAVVQWISNGILYEISARNGDRDGLVKLANRAIQAGPR